jgi:undecaprenyl-diphosphatase
VRDGAVVAVLRVASRFGDRGLSLTVGLVLAVVEPLALLVFSGATAAALLIQGRLKVLCARMRPCAHPGGPPQRAPIPDAGSFPSGHTLHAVMGAVVIVAQVPVLALVFAAVAVLIGTSRVVLGVHYPTDVLAGALIGLLLGSASNLVIALI